jgi:peptide subunit release factor 1 (eRF1)
VDHLTLDSKAPVDDVLKATVDALSRENERSDREKVEAAMDAYRAGGLGVVGPEDTLEALVKGQVDELLLTTDVGTLQGVSPEVVAAATANDSTLLEPAVDTAAGGEAAHADPQVVRLADELVKRAKQTAARVTFIEDVSLLKAYGGVAALLRFRI